MKIVVLKIFKEVLGWFFMRRGEKMKRKYYLQYSLTVLSVALGVILGLIFTIFIQIRNLDLVASFWVFIVAFVVVCFFIARNTAKLVHLD